MESKRKLMEELLALKQEVNQLRRAAEQNEKTDKKEILNQFKDQILTLRTNQNQLQSKYDEQERKASE